MKKIIVDTNIIFSSFLNVNSRIAQILINGHKFYDFYAPKYVRTEIFEHKEKIKQLSKLTENRFIETYELLLKGVEIINHSIIPTKIYFEAETLCQSIDIDDTAFVALAKFLHARLWTGDHALIKGLERKGFNQTVSTKDLYIDFLMKEKK